MKPLQTALAAAFCTLLAACAPMDPDRESLRGLDQADASIAPSKGQTSTAPAALILGSPVSAAELTPRLEEAAGSVILEEVALGRFLDKAVADSGIVVSQQDIDAELGLLAQTMGDEARLSPEQAQSTINDLRRTRGLGPVRFADLLARNAKLRALVRPQVDVSADEVDQALAAEFGPQARIRIIRAPTERQAVEIKEAILKDLDLPLPPPEQPEVGPPAPLPLEDPMLIPTQVAPADFGTVVLRFSQAALQSSTDSTAPRGGLIPSISPIDQALPSSLRRALGAMQPGELSAVLSADGGYMLVLYESRTEPKGGPDPQDRDRTETRLRFRKERIAMDRLARQLLGTAGVSAIDPSLRWSWDARPRK